MKRHNYSQEGFLILIGLLIFSAAGVYGEEESITLTTYYPSPYGVYNEMRMYPHSPATVDCIPGNENQAKGTLYYDSAQDRLKVCGGDPLDWQDISGYWRLSGTSLFPRENNWNVGIGTDQPSTKLTIDFGNEVIPGVNANGIALIGNNNPGIIAARGAQELFTIGGVTSAAAYTTDSQLGDGVFASPGRILFGTGVVGSPPNAPTRMTITSNGNVGIGTTDPEPVGWPLPVRLGVEGGAIRSNSNRIYLTGGDSTGMFWINRGPDEGGFPLVNPEGDNLIGWNSAPGFSGREVIIMGRTVIGQPSPAWARQNLLVTGDADINGRVTIRGGNPGAGKVLTSDKDGVASWQDSAIDFSPGLNGSETDINPPIALRQWAYPAGINRRRPSPRAAILNFTNKNASCNDTVIELFVYGGGPSLGYVLSRVDGGSSDVKGDFAIVPLVDYRYEYRRIRGDSCNISVRTIGFIY